MVYILGVLHPYLLPKGRAPTVDATGLSSRCQQPSNLSARHVDPWCALSTCLRVARNPVIRVSVALSETLQLACDECACAGNDRTTGLGWPPTERKCSWHSRDRVAFDNRAMDGDRLLAIEELTRFLDPSVAVTVVLTFAPSRPRTDVNRADVIRTAQPSTQSGLLT